MAASLALPWRIFRDFAQGLIRTARELYGNEPLGIEFGDSVYAFDSSTIDLCLTLFPWAQFRRRKSAVKLHALLDVRGSIPTNVYVTGGQVHDVNLFDELLLEPGAFYLLDRGYLDFARLYRMTQAGAFFITRAKINTQFYRRGSRLADKATGIRSDQTVVLTGPKTSQLYPSPLRRVHSFDPEKELRLIFLTNNFPLPDAIIAQLYLARWQVELFFRWIKQPVKASATVKSSPCEGIDYGHRNCESIPHGTVKLRLTTRQCRRELPIGLRIGPGLIGRLSKTATSVFRDDLGQGATIEGSKQ